MIFHVFCDNIVANIEYAWMVYKCAYWGDGFGLSIDKRGGEG